MKIWFWRVRRWKLIKLFVERAMTVERDESCFWSRLCQSTGKITVARKGCVSQEVRQSLLEDAKTVERE
jgi:hypothetical protein